MEYQKQFSQADHLRRIAKLGWSARTKLYGNPGTKNGRRLGGLRSLETHQRKNTGFKTLRIIKTISYSSELAEFMGILMGDGHLSEYQVLIVTNKNTDHKHAIFIQNLARDLFHLPVSLKNRQDENAVQIIISSKDLVRKLSGLGMPVGNKIKKGLYVPRWIFSNNEYRKAFIRGVFDTDGCIYLDKHRRGEKRYEYLGWTITSYADTFISGLRCLLLGFGFSPTNKPSQKSIFLRHQDEIVRFFKVIGTSNSKHQKRFNRFSKGRVPKRS